MKITRRQLRRLIREMAWDPKSSPYAHPGYVYPHLGQTARSVRRSPEYQKFLDSDRSHEYHRAIGMQSSEVVEKEKQILRDYHANNKIEITKFYNELKKPPQTSRVTCLHGLGYEGNYSDKHDFDITSWVDRFGMSGKDQLSTVMFPCGVSELYKYFSGGFQKNSGSYNVDSVMWEPAFIMSGFPTMMNYADMMTQTLSNLHPDLVNFQSSSGISKTSGVTPDISNFELFLKTNVISEETVLDNWVIKGVHSTFDYYESSLFGNKNSYAQQLADECKELGIQLWLTFIKDKTTNRIV